MFLTYWFIWCFWNNQLFASKGFTLKCTIFHKRIILLCIPDSNQAAAGRKDCACNKVIWYLNVIASAHILIAQNKLDDAECILQRLIENATAGDRVYMIIEMRLRRVLIFALEADTAAALAELKRLVATGGVIWPLPWLTPMMAAIWKGWTPSFIQAAPLAKKTASLIGRETDERRASNVQHRTSNECILSV